MEIGQDSRFRVTYHEPWSGEYLVALTSTRSEARDEISRSQRRGDFGYSGYYQIEDRLSKTVQYV